MRSAGTLRVVRFGPPIDFLPVTDRTLDQEPRRRLRRAGVRLGLGRHGARPEEGAVRHPARRVGRACSSCTRARDPARTAERMPRPDRARRDDLGARDRHLPHRHRRAQARRARQARRPRGQDRRRSRSRGGRSRDARSPTTPASTSAWTGASSTCASAGAEPDLPRADHVPARAAHLVGRARLHRDPHPEAHGVAHRSRSAELFEVELLRGQGVPRAEPAVLQADGAAGRLRQGLRGRARVPRRPVVHRRGTRPSSSRSTPRSRWIDSHEDVMRDARGAPRRRPHAR